MAGGRPPVAGRSTSERGFSLREAILAGIEARAVGLAEAQGHRGRRDRLAAGGRIGAGAIVLAEDVARGSCVADFVARQV